MENKIENIVKGYITGFFDGEGTIHIRKQNWYLVLQITNTNYGILKKFELFFGGSISKKSLELMKNGEYGKQKWEWTVDAKNRLKFLHYIQPYSIIKRKQIELGIRYINEIDHTKKIYQTRNSKKRVLLH